LCIIPWSYPRGEHLFGQATGFLANIRTVWKSLPGDKCSGLFGLVSVTKKKVFIIFALDDLCLGRPNNGLGHLPDAGVGERKRSSRQSNFMQFGFNWVTDKKSIGMYYKSFTIAMTVVSPIKLITIVSCAPNLALALLSTIMIISDATIWSVTYWWS
jgi:hypothetical protein